MELLSCFACVFGDNSLEHLVAADIRKLMPEISKIRAQMLKHFGYEGNPVLIIREALVQHAT